MPRSITVRAFAKINLDLRVLGIRPDGYHELRTTFQSIALADRLTFRPTPGAFRIECDDPACPTDRSNLIWKAADLVSKHRKRRPSPSGVTVRVEKNIPMQAGLGGDVAELGHLDRVIRDACVLDRGVGAGHEQCMLGGPSAAVREQTPPAA